MSPTRSGDGITVPWLESPPFAEARLRLELGDRELVVGKDSPVVRYGRGEENELAVGDDFASRSHGEIWCQEGKFFLKDTSRNGTFVVWPHSAALYVHEDTVRLVSEGEIRLGRRAGARIGFRIEVRQSDAVLWTPVSSLETSPETLPSGNLFRREGEFWTIRFAGEVIRLKDSKGLRLIAELLSCPNRDVLALDLAQRVSMDEVDERRVVVTGDDDLMVNDGGGTGPRLDERAKASYRERARELREDLVEAEQMNDMGRLERARQELSFIERELGRALGFQGRDRPQISSSGERARIAVTVRVKKMLAKVEQCHPALGEHLRRSIRTGRSCCYEPGGNSPEWTF